MMSKYGSDSIEREFAQKVLTLGVFP